MPIRRAATRFARTAFYEAQAGRMCHQTKDKSRSRSERTTLQTYSPHLANGSVLKSEHDIAKALSFSTAVCDVQNSHLAAIPQSHKQCNEIVASFVVEGTEWFVEEQHRRARCKSPTQRHTMLFPTTEEVRLAVEQVRKPKPVGEVGYSLLDL